MRARRTKFLQDAAASTLLSHLPPSYALAPGVPPRASLRSCWSCSMSFDFLMEEPDADRYVAPPIASAIEPDNSVFEVVSYKGSDPYSQAGGLGVRVAGLVDTLAEMDYETHLFFIGDPYLPGEEKRHDGRLILHRWSQWISANCPGGAYDGEAGKVADVSSSLPLYLVDNVLLPAIAAGKIPMLLFEEWQPAECACR